MVDLFVEDVVIERVEFLWILLLDDIGNDFLVETNDNGDFLDCVVIPEPEGMIKLEIHEALAVFKTEAFFIKKN